MLLHPHQRHPACQNPLTLGILKGWGLRGFVAPDAVFAIRDIVAAANAGVDNFQLGSLRRAARAPRCRRR